MTTNSTWHGARKKIVVVEDDADFQVLVSMILAAPFGDGLDIIPANTGDLALTAIRQQRPDLVILDISLPDISGWEVFMAMRADPNSSNIPVIILSSQGTRLERSFGVQVAQVHDYLTKPCLPSRLRQSVATALGL